MNNYFMSGKLMHKASDHNTKRCEVEKWVFLPHSDFERLKANPYQEHEAITAARDLMYEDKNAYHCIMLLDEHGDDGLLIEAESLIIGSGLSLPLYKTQAVPVSSRTTEKSSQTGR